MRGRNAGLESAEKNADRWSRGRCSYFEMEVRCPARGDMGLLRISSLLCGPENILTSTSEGQFPQTMSETRNSLVSTSEARSSLLSTSEARSSGLCGPEDILTFTSDVQIPPNNK